MITSDNNINKLRNDAKWQQQPTMTSSVVEYHPSLIFKHPHEYFIYNLLELEDGSFASCSHDNTAKRWSISSNNQDDNCNNKTLQLVGTLTALLSGWYRKTATV